MVLKLSLLYVSNEDISISNISINKYVFDNKYIFVNSIPDIYLVGSESAKEIEFCPNPQVCQNAV